LTRGAGCIGTILTLVSYTTNTIEPRNKMTLLARIARRVFVAIAIGIVSL